MSAAWEPPGGPARVIGGLLAVAGGEAFVAGFDQRGLGDPLPPAAGPGVGGLTTLRDGRVNHRCEPDGPVTAALVDLCHSYVARRGRGIPTDVAERHAGVVGPGWLLGAAVVRFSGRDVMADTLALASASGASSRALGDYVAYAQLAAGLLAGRSPMEVIDHVTGGWPAGQAGSSGRSGIRGVVGSEPRGEPCLSGEPAVDALAAGVWAILQPGGIADVLPRLAELTTPSVGAAAAGLLGLRDGRDAVPVHWQRRLRSAASCLALAPGLVRARCRDHLGQVVASSRQAALAGAAS